MKNQMQIEKKLILCSILAITIGVATIMPLSFLMSANAQTNPEEQPQFNIDIPYAYIGNIWKNDSAINSPQVIYFSYDGKNYSEAMTVYTIAFNSTPRFDQEKINADAVFEYYLIEVSSEKNFIGNFTYSTYNSQHYQNFHFSRDQWFNSTTNYIFCITSWGTNPTLGFTSGIASNWNLGSDEPKTLQITVQRLGWVILTDNSTIAYRANPNEIILQIELQKYSDGFLYNNAIPEDELSQINLLTPQLKLNK